MKNSIMKDILLVLFYSLILAVIAYVVAIPISRYFHATMQDATFYEGLVMVLIGIMLSSNPNAAGLNPWGMGWKIFPYQANDNVHLQLKRVEKEFTNNYKHFIQHPIGDYAFSGITILLGGILIIL
ncbi:MAG: hypothetical protein ACOX6S_13180 [Clostridia bacterium]|jgi:hypothetical protein